MTKICCSSHSVIGGGEGNEIGCNGVANCNNATFGGFRAKIDGGCFNVIGAGDSNCTLNSCFTFTTGSSGAYFGGNCFSANLGLAGGSNVNNTTTVGTLYKTSGTFTINHPNPNKPHETLSHSFVETPTVGDNIYKYRVKAINCQASICLPDYYKHLNCNDHAHVSPVNNLGTAYAIVNEEQTTVTICTTADGDYDVILLGTRKDKDALSQRFNQVGAERIVSTHPYSLIKFV